jgi:hypothetical protein
LFFVFLSLVVLEAWFLFVFGGFYTPLATWLDYLSPIPGLSFVEDLVTFTSTLLAFTHPPPLGVCIPFLFSHVCTPIMGTKQQAYRAQAGMMSPAVTAEAGIK